MSDVLYERSDDPSDPCSLCATWVCGYCRQSWCEDDDCPGVVDQGAIVPIDPVTGELTRLYRNTHKRCQESVDFYMEEVRRESV